MQSRPKITDYKAIAAWGKYVGSYQYYIIGEQRRALEDDAPFDAIFYSDSEKRWVTLRDLKNDSLRMCIETHLRVSKRPESRGGERGPEPLLDVDRGYSPED